MPENNIEIPTRIPVMTLRGVVLFPSSMMPLRIFEERYRQMLDDVLGQDRMFAIVREREDVTSDQADMELPYEVATVGLVRISKKHDDGTSFVLLQGLHRVRIKSILQEDPYRILEIEPVDTEVEATVPEVRELIVDSLKHNIKLGGLVSDEIMEMLTPLEDTSVFVDLAAHHVCRDPDDKQKMLETSSLHDRASCLLHILHAENEKLSFFNQTLGEKGQDEIDSN
jgi:Lon protease-like protein